MEEREIIELAEKVKSLGGNPVKVINYYQAELESAMEWVVKLKGHCEDLLPEFNIPELNDFLNEGKK